MTDLSKSLISIDAPIEAVQKALFDLDKYPEWSTQIKSAEALAREQAGGSGAHSGLGRVGRRAVEHGMRQIAQGGHGVHPHRQVLAGGDGEVQQRPVYAVLKDAQAAGYDLGAHRARMNAVSGGSGK